MARVLITLPEDLLFDLDQEAAIKRSSRSEYIRDAVKEKMKADGFDFRKTAEKRGQTQEAKEKYKIVPGKKRINAPNAVRTGMNATRIDNPKTKPAEPETEKPVKAKAKKVEAKPAVQKSKPIAAKKASVPKATKKTATKTTKPVKAKATAKKAKPAVAKTKTVAAAKPKKATRTAAKGKTLVTAGKK
jgi:hypothetical protein